RENTTEHLGGIYEFPRELKKLRQQVVQFLVDLGRPSELSTNPFIRGFYFSGVRAVMVDEMSNAPAQMQAQQVASGGGGATKMFSMAEMRAQMAGGAVAQPQRVRRKVPQWICLSKFFSQVLLQDRVALGASVQSTKTTTLRRLVYAGAIAACLLVAVLWTISFFKNHALQQQAVAAAQDLALVDSAAAQNPNITDLRKLDALRQTLSTLIDYDRNGAPLMYRLGLYSGSQILPEVRHVYFQEF